MSMINEFVEKLREKSALFSRSDFAVAGIAKDYKEAADMIEELSAKLSSVNLERSEQYCKDVPDTNVGKWIPVSEKLPDIETEVIVLAKRNFKGGDFRYIITTALYEDGTVLENDSIWHWNDLDGEWNEEEDCYIIPRGWWEYRHYNMDEVYNNAIDDEVIAWQPLPEPYKGE